MTPRAAVRLAWGLWGLALALIVAALAVNTVQVTTGEEGLLAVLSLVFITTGAFLAGRRPANPVGWLLLGWGMVMASAPSPVPMSIGAWSATPARCPAPAGSAGPRA